MLDRTKARQAVNATDRAADLKGARKWADSRSVLDLTVYSDGSMYNCTAGAGFCVSQGPKTVIVRGQQGLGQLATVYGAEVTAAALGLQAALDSPMAAYATDVTVCLDDEEAAIRLLASRPTATNAKAFDEFKKLRKAWNGRPMSLAGQADLVQLTYDGFRDIEAPQATSSPTV